MSRSSLSLLLLALFAIPLQRSYSQITVDQHDGTTDFTARGIPANVAGWVHNGWKVDRQGGGIGIGIRGWTSTIQDQNCATLSPFQLAIFGGNADPVTGLPGTPRGWGQPNTWPDISNVIAATPVFVGPTGPSAPCAWIFQTSFATPIDTSLMGDLFTSVWLPSAIGWVGDGLSSHISTAAPAPGSASREYPVQSADPATQLEISTEFGLCWLNAGPIGTPPGSNLVPTPPRYWLSRLRYDHASRAGVRDTTGGFGPLFGASGPRNFGMAGSYPDAVNRSGQPALTPRADELIWSDEHVAGFGFGGTGIGQVLLATRLLRTTAGGLFPMPGQGLLELDPTDPLFLFGSYVPGLTVPIATRTGPTFYEPLVPLAQQPGIGALLHRNQVDLFAQVLRLDLVAGTASLGSLDAHSFRR
ncbi:MAG: hypothetical protein JNM84_11170 [Planctomycetes bacterium]|nr:hypothetical protein [Planctomycetota bacterium]